MENKKTRNSLLENPLFGVCYCLKLRAENETKYHIDIQDIVLAFVLFPPHIVKTFLKIVHLLYS